MTETQPKLASQAERPGLPRRVFLAAGLSAVTAAAGGGLYMLGAAMAPAGAVFQFTRGTGFAEGEELRLRGFLAEAAKDTRTIVVITGHTGDQGDAEANLALSTDRAERAATIAREIGVGEDQLRVSGVGGAAPLGREDGMSDRAYQALLARVEITLQVRR